MTATRTIEMPYRAARFVLDGIGVEPEHQYQGYTNGETWNGWECPFFTREEAERLATYFRTRWGCDFAYDAARDAYVYKPCNHKTPQGEDCEGQPWEEEIVYRTIMLTITPNGQEMPFYGIGAWEWTWDEWTAEFEAQRLAEAATA